MHRWSYPAALTLLLLFAAPATAQFQTPAAAVEALYASYGLGSDADKNGFDDKLAAQVFDTDLLHLYQRAVQSDGLDSDFFVQGNAFSLVKPIEIDKVSVVGSRANVSATLTQNLVGDKSPVRHFTFALVKSDKGWQIDDAFHNGRSVRTEWKEAITNANPN